MSRIAQLWRTTTVRLTAIFIALFVVFSILLLAFVAYQSSIQIQQQQTVAIDREVQLLQRIDTRQGVRGIVFAVARLASQPGPGIYYLGDAAGLQIAGNVSNFPANVLQSNGVFSFNYERDPAFPGDSTQGFAVVRSLVLDSGLRLIVGRDVVERRGFTNIVFQGFLLAVAGILAFSVLAGVITARRVLSRIDAINATSAKIMSGNLSERIPVTRRNDEFDALATSLNAMLDRIEALMQGLKEVTDNVAHDLKTPLTRLRNRAEAALRGDGSAQREALETTLNESDKLIRTFNALLMIARAEAGAPSGVLADVDVSAVAADVAELYEPAAEEAGMTLETAIAPDVHLRGNRELIGQALVNLIENALKYYEPAEGKAGRISLGVRAEAGRVRIEVGDNGPGIPAEDRERVVERFVRLEKSRTEPGSGLGLSLVAAVARLHRGTFRIEDNQPGVLAVIDLPATP
ncbi:MAG TPA: HAMP domain-containing sensor histidine kinase [Hypericibacter adhaerens]|uniref:sensor histidine kinase n=1 Tax=Hypericibacter adhaerens TaxID=2602016 RepID=UPI002C5998E5|nr:HAMP domain-containing sensor histidine kinase [Hypericibacter adhaerens]HWA42367.1 HAMP domain-containing sensor histidine kinase [Hypericibacter adhaerens]